jgi:hypothetical protein
MQTCCIPTANLAHAHLPGAKVVETLDHGGVDVHPNGPSITVLLVQLHPDTGEEHHAPVPAIFQGGEDFGAGSSSLKEWGRGDEEDVVHPHLLVVCKQLLKVTRELIRPDVFSLNQEVVCPALQEMNITAQQRYNDFSCSVSKARIWNDDIDLFCKVKSIAAEFMEELANVCQLQYEKLCCDSHGQDLAAYGVSESLPSTQDPESR